MLAPTWRRLSEFVARGATVYLSYCSGTHDRHRGPWFPKLNEMFGVEHQLAYGLNNPIEDEVVELTFVTGFGGIPKGELLRFLAGGNEHMAATIGQVNPEPTYRIYDALASVAGVDRAVRSGDPRVLTETMTHVDGRGFVWFVSQYPGEITVSPILSGLTLHTLDGEPVTAVTLAPYDVQVFSPRLA